MKHLPHLGFIICSFVILTLFNTANAKFSSVELETYFDSIVSDGKLHGCVIYIQENDKILHFKSYGMRDLKRKLEMENNTIFRIASMTKVFTSLAALKLYEEGFFLLDDPIEKYLPQFSQMRVLRNSDSNIDDTLPVSRSITIRDLFRHTAGFGMEYMPNENNDAVDKAYIAKGLSSVHQSSAEFLSNISTIPLKFTPGDKWQYSYSNDVLGFLVEDIAGKTLHEFLNEFLFKPLDMKDTGFFIKESKVNQLCANYTFNNGKLELIDDQNTGNFLKPPMICSGGGGFENNEGGIVTTAQDFSKVCQMILNYGTFEGQQFLRRQTIEEMISNQISSIRTRVFPLPGYGLGVGVFPLEHEGGTKAVFWSGGPYNTTFNIDFETNRIMIFLTQNSPWCHLGIIEKFNHLSERSFTDFEN